WNGWGSPPVRRYQGGKVLRLAREWHPARLSGMVKNPLYKGQHVLASSRGDVTRDVPPLVSPETWERVQQRLSANRAFAPKNSRQTYLLRGLIVWEDCGRRYVGMSDPRDRARGGSWRYYRCGGQVARNTPGTPRCGGRLIDADWLEDQVWGHCREFIRNPGDALAEAQRQLRER